MDSGQHERVAGQTHGDQPVEKVESPLGKLDWSNIGSNARYQFGSRLTDLSTGVVRSIR